MFQTVRVQASTTVEELMKVLSSVCQAAINCRSATTVQVQASTTLALKQLFASFRRVG